MPIKFDLGVWAGGQNKWQRDVGVTKCFLIELKPCLTWETHAWYCESGWDPWLSSSGAPGSELPPIILLNGHSIQLSSKSISLYPKMSAPLRPQQRRSVNGGEYRHRKSSKCKDSANHKWDIMPLPNDQWPGQKRKIFKTQKSRKIRAEWFLPTGSLHARALHCYGCLSVLKPANLLTWNAKGFVSPHC